MAEEITELCSYNYKSCSWAVFSRFKLFSEYVTENVYSYNYVVEKGAVVSCQ